MAISSLAAVAFLAVAAREHVPPSFAGEADVVMVDVAVLDEQGKPVTGLGAADFSVSDNGAQQEVSIFEAVETPLPAEGTIPPGTRFVSTNALGDLRPLLLVVVDEPHLTAGGAQLARRYLREALDDPSLVGTEVAILSPAGRGSWTGLLPGEREGLSAALERLSGRPHSGPLDEYESMMRAEARDSSVSASCRTQIRAVDDLQRLVSRVRADGDGTLPWLTRLLRGLASRPGRKAVLWVTEGSARGRPPDQREVAEAARHGRAAVHFVDVRDPMRWTSRHDAESDVVAKELAGCMDGHDVERRLKDAEGAVAVALASGGRVVRSLPALRTTVAAVTSTLRSYYVLGYAPNAAPDGRYHRLAVAVKRPGVSVESRPGYYAVRSGPGSEGTVTPATATQTLAEASFVAGTLPVQLAGYVLGRDRKRSRVRLVGEVVLPEFPVDGAAATFDVVFQLVSNGGRDLDERRATGALDVERGPGGEPRARFEAEFLAAPGAHQARLAVRDRASGQSGNARHPIVVTKERTLHTSTPVLTDTVRGTPPRIMPVLRAERRFQQGGTLYCQVEAFDASAAGPLSAGLEIRDRDGRRRLGEVRTPLPGTTRSRLWAVPLDGLTPGEYEAHLFIEDAAGQTVEHRERFEVEAPSLLRPRERQTRTAERAP